MVAVLLSLILALIDTLYWDLVPEPLTYLPTLSYTGAKLFKRLLFLDDLNSLILPDLSLNLSWIYFNSKLFLKLGFGLYFLFADLTRVTSFVLIFSC